MWIRKETGRNVCVWFSLAGGDGGAFLALSRRKSVKPIKAGAEQGPRYNYRTTNGR